MGFPHLKVKSNKVQQSDNLKFHKGFHWSGAKTDLLVDPQVLRLIRSHNKVATYNTTSRYFIALKSYHVRNCLNCQIECCLEIYSEKNKCVLLPV